MSAINALAALDDNLTLIPRFIIEPPDTGDALEYTRQRGFVNRIRRDHPHILVAGVPNGSKDSDWSRLRKHGEGTTRGFPDLTLWWSRGVATLEFKAGRTMPSQAQIEVGNRLVAMGHRYAVVRSVDFAMALMREWGAIA